MYKDQSHRIGKFRDIITVLSKNQVSNGSGGFITSYSVLMSFWADVESRPTDFNRDDTYEIQGSQRVLRTIYNVTARYRSDKTIPNDAVIEWQAKKYKLAGPVINKGGFNATIRFKIIDIE